MWGRVTLNIYIFYFMAVLIICKFDEDSIKNEISIIQTTFKSMGPSMSGTL